MTKDVIISMTGMHDITGELEENLDPVESTYVGKYYKKDGEHYLFYEEASAGAPEMTSSRIVFNDSAMYFRKRGSVNSDFFLERGKRTLASYSNELGVLDIDVMASGFSLTEKEDVIDYRVSYAMTAFDDIQIDCVVMIHVTPRSAGLES